MRAVGLDVGTGTIVCAETDKDGQVYHKTRDAFFRIDLLDLMKGSVADFGETMLKKSGVNYIKVDGNLHILGEDAFKFANLFHKECLRPMAKGVLNPREPIARAMVAELIRGVVGQGTPEDIIYYCVPANPIDADFDIVYHTETLRETLQRLGYKQINVMTEGLAIVYSECAATQYTGVGISWGAGMVNVAFSYFGMPVFAFSISRAGDWIDINAAKACNETAAAMQLVKESDMSILEPADDLQRAVAVYYDALINYVVEKFCKLYAEVDPKTLPHVTQPIDVVFSGGTSLIKGFAERLKTRIDAGFPVPVGNVVQAAQPLLAVSHGLMCAAETDRDRAAEKAAAEKAKAAKIEAKKAKAAKAEAEAKKEPSS